MASPGYAFCRLSGAGCVKARCPLADRPNFYLRLHDMPIPAEVRLSPVLPSL